MGKAWGKRLTVGDEDNCFLFGAILGLGDVGGETADLIFSPYGLALVDFSR